MKILYEDKFIIIVEKNRNIPVQKDKTLDKSLLEKVIEHTNISDVSIINRLDRNVGGVVLFSLDKNTTAKLTELTKMHLLTKKYIAVVTGTPKNEEVLTDYLLKNSRLNKSKVVNKNNQNSKKAVLEYETKKYFKHNNMEMAQIIVTLKTGRHHQIRAQLSNANIGLWGDNKYNNIKTYSKVGIGLWSHYLSFNHPITDLFIEVTSPPPKENPFDFY